MTDHTAIDLHAALERVLGHAVDWDAAASDPYDGPTPDDDTWVSPNDETWAQERYDNWLEGCESRGR